VAVLLGCLAWLLAARTEPEIESAADLQGERWYRLMLDERHVGYLHTRAARDPLGRWRFHSDLRFVLSRGKPVKTEEHLVFAASPPYPLLSASQRSERPGDLEGTLIERAGDAYRASRITAGSPGGDRGRLLDLDFTLGDYLSFETWLRESRPAQGATVAVRVLDFARRRVVPRQFRVVDHNPTGYQLESPAPYDAARIQLDRYLRPVAMTLSGLFELKQVTREEALAPRTALQEASYFVRADRPLRDHTEIRALELEVTGRIAASELWPELAEGNALRRAAATVTTPRLLGDELAETADHPVSNPRIRALAREAVTGLADDGARVDALTRFVNGYLRYADDGARRHVLTLLDDPVGDCSEYADLLTTLARALDIPSRTVFGLAYADGRPPAFRFHAWNELLVGGEWRAVDPTWNQLRVDATHIPMPANVGYALDLLTGGLDISFVVRDVEYF
jgi:transglutaminase-like putative cysteine protease